MIKKILIILSLLSIFLFYSTSYANPADREIEQREAQAEREAQRIRDEQMQQRNEECDDSGDCLDRPSFMLSTTNMFDFGDNQASGSTAKGKIDWLLGQVIQKMMIALGIVSLFIMVIGTGFIILYHGQDEFLSKGKNIFLAGIISLVIALSSYYLVSLIRYIIFS